jgi:DNA-binding transcriptional ArsR family regulator
VTAALQQTTARQRLTAIRNALALADDLLAQAYAARDWAALGHASWEAYCAAEIPELRHLKLRAPERRARIQTLRNAAPGISVRELAAATGASVGTVHGDLAAPRPAEPAAGAPGSTVARILAVLDRGPADVFTIAKRTKLRQAQVSPALSRLATAGRITYTPPARRGGTGVYHR